jgi:sugar phosphate isomerase/epimerase
MEFGINLSFALKRWPEPERWAWIVREELGLDLVQFSFDLLDPWWPPVERGKLAARVRRAVADHGLTLHSAQLGLAWYTYNGLLHPDPSGRAIAREWWHRAAETAAEIGAPAMGGPLGALSVTEAADPAMVKQRTREVIEDAIAASDAAATAGLQGILIEPTPLPREIPHTIDQSRQMMNDLRGRTSVPITYVLDVGHALYRPLYGADVAIEDWLTPLRSDIGVVHLQNHDYVSDAHWGWPDPRGSYDVAALGRSLRDTELGEVPVLLELFFPFELADEAVLENTISSVRHCVAALNA